MRLSAVILPFDVPLDTTGRTMPSFSVRLITIVLFICWAADSYGQSEEWYVSGSLIYNNDDADRAIDDSLSGIQFNAGKNLTEHLSLEGMLGYSDMSAELCEPDDCFPDQQHLDLSANLLAYFDRTRPIAPYALVGVGYLGVKAEDGTFNWETGDNAATATVGLGLKWRLGQSNFSIRAEHRARFAFDDTTYTDQLTTIGLQYAFGSKSPDPGISASDKPDDTDGDGDGVLDMWDACPDTTPGVDVSSRGCEIQNIDRDGDNDRVPDHRDECPYTPIGVPVDPCGCSLDSDMDGVTTDKDHCPGSRIGAVVDEFGCESDADGDGVPDHIDQCPDTRTGAKVDLLGCEQWDVISLPGVNFKSGSDLLEPGAEQLIQEAAATLNKAEYLQIEVAGHTDSQGDEVDNQGLSDRRAKTVFDFLVRYGADEDRMSFKGYGESQPIADNATAEGRAINRRVELRVINR